MGEPGFFDMLHDHFSADLPFVAYRKPNERKVKAILQLDDVVHKTVDLRESGFVFAPFDALDDAILIPANTSNILETGNLGMSFNPIQNSDKEDRSLPKEGHLELVKKGIKAIRDGLLKKVVLSRKETIPMEIDDPLLIFRRLLVTYPSAFTYLWYHPKIGLWLGATPETLLSVKGHQVSSMALAGTQAFEGTMETNWGPKEVEEQKLVTDFLVRNLRPFIDALDISDTKTIRAGNLLHLRTDISGRLSSIKGDLKGMIDSLHPTPAICGLPREIAKQFILENEDYDREYYSGFLGELNMKESVSRNRRKENVENNAYKTVRNVCDLFVNLRCMQIKNGYAEVYVGGGITKDSVPESEWEETINKTSTIKEVLIEPA